MSIAWAADRRISSTQLLVDLDGVRYRGEYVLRDGRVFVFFAGTLYGEEECSDEVAPLQIAHKLLKTRLVERISAKNDVVRAPNNRRVRRSPTPDVTRLRTRPVTRDERGNFTMFRNVEFGISPTAHCRYCQDQRPIAVERGVGTLSLRCLACDTEESASTASSRGPTDV